MQKISRVIGITDCQLSVIVLLRQQIRIKAPVSLRIRSVMLPDNHRIVGGRSGPNSGRLFIKSLKSSVGAKTVRFGELRMLCLSLSSVMP